MRARKEEMTSGIHPYLLILLFLGTWHTKNRAVPVLEELVHSIGKKIYNQAGFYGKGGIRLTFE